jgi:anti-sigma factor RsiW
MTTQADEGGGGSMRLSDDILSAYIDGELPMDETAGVALALTRDPGAARRLNALRRGDAVLAEAFDWSRPGEAELSASVAAWIQRAELSRARVRRVALLAMSAFAAAAIGYGVGKVTPSGDHRLGPVQGARVDEGSVTVTSP